MRRPRTLARWLLVAFALPAFALSGCKDGRGDPVAPDTGSLDGDSLFGSALISALIFSTQNAVVEQVLAIHDSGAALPQFLDSCAGGGRALISDLADADPNTYAIDFSAGSGEGFLVGCFGGGVRLSFQRNMFLRFLETSPGLVYEIAMPFDLTTGEPQGVTVQLPGEFGSIILSVTAPYGPVLYELDGTRATDGTLLMTGTVRLEDRSGGLTLIEELQLTWGYDEAVSPTHSAWPGGSYEIAANGQSGVPGTPGAPGFPVDVTFDGNGGCTFDHDGRHCVVNLATGENPCDD